MQGTLRGDLWLPAVELLELKLAGALGASRGLRGSRSARDAASIRHVAHYFGLITLLLWARVRRMQRRSETGPRITHWRGSRGGATLAAGGQMLLHQMMAAAPALCQQGSQIKH